MTDPAPSYRFRKLEPAPVELTRYEVTDADGTVLGIVMRMAGGYWKYQAPDGPSLPGAQTRYEAAWCLDELRRHSA